MDRLTIRVLGPIEVHLGGNRLDLGTRKQRALLAMLLIERGQVVTADRIAMALWGEDAPPQRRNDVFVYVSRLRKALGPAADALTTVGAGYLLDVDDDAVDATRFSDLAAEGARLVEHDPPAASLTLQEALAMWSGEPFGEFAADDFAAPTARPLRERKLTTIEAKAKADLAWMDPDELIPEIETLVTAHPTRHRLVGSLMVALYRRGRQHAALAAYRTFSKQLANATGLDPPEELRLLEEQILMDDPALRAETLATTRIPSPISPPIGRGSEVATIVESLRTHRLTTLTGIGGVGKTTLAIEAARSVGLRFDDAAFTDLTAIDAGSDLLGFIAASFAIDRSAGGIRERLARRLRNRRVLLVLDNCEHVVSDVAPIVVELLGDNAGLTVLTTTRVALNIPGERLVEVAPLPTTRGGAAETLLAARIADAGAGAFSTVDETELRSLTELTAGLPLAIELCAAQLRTWPAPDVVEALRTSLPALGSADRIGPDRHRELRTSVAWSERLLSPTATALLRRLSVFRGGFTLDAARAVGGFAPLDEHTAAEVLSVLVGASLVQRGEHDRYSILEPIRQYAAARLTDAGESDDVAMRHAVHYLEVFEPLGEEIDLGHAGTLDAGLRDSENLLAAARYLIAYGSTDGAVRITHAGIPLWRETMSYEDILRLTDAVFDRATEPTVEKARLLFRSLATYSVGRGEQAAWDQLAELSATATALDRPSVTALANARQADVISFFRSGDDALAANLYRSAIEGMHADEPVLRLTVLSQFSWFLFWRGSDEASAVMDDLSDSARRLGAKGFEATAHRLRAWIALADGDPVAAEVAEAKAGDIYRDLGSPRSVAFGYQPLAIASLLKGDIEEARRRAAVAMEAARESGAVEWLDSMLITAICVDIASGYRESAIASFLSMLDRDTERVPYPGDVTALATRLIGTDDPAAAAALLGAAKAASLLTEQHGDVVGLAVPALDSMTGRPRDYLTRVMGPDEFARAWDRGQTLTPTEAIAVARDALSHIG